MTKTKRIHTRLETDDLAKDLVDPALASKFGLTGYSGGQRVPLIAGETRVVETDANADGTGAAGPGSAQISKKKLRRQKFLEARREREATRAQLYEALSKDQLTAEQQAQLRSSRHLGQPVSHRTRSSDAGAGAGTTSGAKSGSESEESALFSSESDDDEADADGSSAAAAADRVRKVSQGSSVALRTAAATGGVTVQTGAKPRAAPASLSAKPTAATLASGAARMQVPLAASTPAVLSVRRGHILQHVAPAVQAEPAPVSPTAAKPAGEAPPNPAPAAAPAAAAATAATATGAVPAPALLPPVWRWGDALSAGQVVRAAESTPAAAAAASAAAGQSNEAATPAAGPTSFPAGPLPWERSLHDASVAPLRTRSLVSVTRPAEVEQSRQALPIVGEEGTIMDALSAHHVLLVCAETGSGKTTQVPQFLYEAGYAGERFPGAIVVTQPRRVAAIAASQRVGYELGNPALVGYSVRHASTITPSTKIRFLTDGVLLRMARADMLLRDVSVVVVDEAHERAIDTDVLLGLLSRIVRLRANPPPQYAHLKPLRLVVMSATLRTTDFTENPRLFSPPPAVVQVSGRQHPVSVHFSRRTEENYVEAAYRKVCAVHRRLPPGGILVFLTGREEVLGLVRRLRATFPAAAGSRPAAAETEHTDSEHARAPGKGKKGKRALAAAAAAAMADWTEMEGDEAAPDESDSEAELGVGADADDEESVPLASGSQPPGTAAADAAEPGTAGGADQGSDAGEHGADGSAAGGDGAGAADGTELRAGPVLVLPLFAIMEPEAQMRVFRPPPEGARLIVVATNVAETSVTIPGVRYVVDSGRVKERVWDTRTGTSSMQIGWISQAAADQRAGRAGRTGPGHCCRLYTAAAFGNIFPPHTPPAILRVPVPGVVLHLKAMGIERVAQFPFPSPPDAEQLTAAVRSLMHLQALDAEERITPLGRAMAALPLEPRFARMLVLGATSQVLPHAVALVAALAVDDPRISSLQVGEDASGSGGGSGSTDGARAMAARAQAVFQHAQSDALTLMRVHGAYAFAPAGHSFCAQFALREAPLLEARALRLQLAQQLNRLRSRRGAEPLDGRMPPPPKPAEDDLLLQLICAGYCDRVARRERMEGRRPVYLSMWEPARELQLHPGSAVVGAPELLVYRDVTQGRAASYLVGVTVVQASWLPRVGRALCSFGPALQDPPPRYDAARGKPVAFFPTHFGPSRWPLPPVELEFPAAQINAAVRVLARALLEGAVCTKLAAFTPHLVSSPALVTRGATITRVAMLVQTLQSQKVVSRAALFHKWKHEPSFLLDAYLMWLPADQHAAVRAIWPPKA